MVELNVANMTCGHCVNTVTKAIRTVDAGAVVQVDLQLGRVSVQGSAAAGDLIKAVSDAGYPARVAKFAKPIQPAKRACCCA